MKTIWVVRRGEWVRYGRTGSCLGCGECCSKFNYSFQQTIPPKEQSEHGEGDWAKWEGWAIEDWDKDGEWHWWGPFEIIPLDQPKCKTFDPKTNHCQKFGKEDWREICRKFPFRPEDLAGLTNCGFAFKEIT